MPADLPPDPTIASEEVRRVVDEVLSRPEYAGVEPGLLQRAFDRMLEAVAQAFGAAAGTGPGRAVGIVVLVGLAGMLAWLLVRALRRVRWDRGAPVEVGGPAGRSPDEWLAAASAHERDGDLREALRCQYRALLAWLAARGLIKEVAGTTTGEYREAVTRALPIAAEAFGAITAAFERAWYGRQPVARPQLESAIAAARQVRDAASQPAGAAS